MKSLLLAAASLLLPMAALSAQPPAGGPDPAQGEQHRQDELRDLSIVLGLKPSQQPALATWMAAMRPPMPLLRRDMRAATPQPSTTPERLDAKQAHMADRQRYETSKIAATKTFYATLDAHQRQVFDALDRLRHDRHDEHRGWGGHGGRPHGGPDMPPPPPGDAAR